MVFDNVLFEDYFLAHCRHVAEEWSSACKLIRLSRTCLFLILIENLNSPPEKHRNIPQHICRVPTLAGPGTV